MEIMSLLIEYKILHTTKLARAPGILIKMAEFKDIVPWYGSKEWRGQRGEYKYVEMEDEIDTCQFIWNTLMLTTQSAKKNPHSTNFHFW